MDIDKDVDVSYITYFIEIDDDVDVNYTIFYWGDALCPYGAANHHVVYWFQIWLEHFIKFDLIYFSASKHKTCVQHLYNVRQTSKTVDLQYTKLYKCFVFTVVDVGWTASRLGVGIWGGRCLGLG